MVRAGFRMLVDSQADLTSSARPATAARRCSGSRPRGADVVLMDVRMPRLDGVEATRLLAARADAPRVIVLTTFDLDEYAFAAIKAGAAAFLLKDAAAARTCSRAIRTVHAGDAVVAPSTTRRLLEHFAAPCPIAAAAAPDDARSAVSPTASARCSCSSAAAGPTSEIAADLVVAEATVKTHVGRLLAKTGSRDRVQLVVLAYETGSWADPLAASQTTVVRRVRPTA